MKRYQLQAQVEESGKLTLENLPFAAGEMVEIIITPVPQPTEESPLRGTVNFYKDPTAPVADGDWDALSVLESMAGTVEGPPDWAAEHDHYVHGTPKRTDHQDKTPDAPQ